MADMVGLIWGDGIVTADEALEVFEVLAPVLDAAPQDREATDAATRLLQRVTDATLVASVLDWWLIVGVGVKSANGHAYSLPEVITGDLRSAMEAVRDLQPGIPAAAWVRARRKLNAGTAELDRLLDPESYGAVKLDGERHTWAILCEWLEPTISAIRTGDVVEPFALKPGKLEKELKGGGLDENSRRWKEMVKRANLLVTSLNDLVELTRTVRPRIHRQTWPEVEHLPVEITDAFGPLAGLLFEALLVENPDEAITPDSADEAIAAALERAAVATDDIGRLRLADVVDSWVDLTRQTVPSLDPSIAALADLRRRTDELEAQGVDVEEAQIHLLDYDLRAATAQLEQLELARRSLARASQLRQRLDAFGQRLEMTELADDGALHDLLDQAAAALDDDDLDTADQLLRAGDRQLGPALRKRRLEEMRELVAELSRLDAPQSVLFDLEAELLELDDDAQKPISEARLEEVRQHVDQHRGEQAERARVLVSRLRRVIDDAEDVPAEIRADIEALIIETDEDLDIDTDTVIVVLDRAPDLLASVERRRASAWTLDQGEAQLVAHVVDYCVGQMDFAESDVRRFIVALKSKPFVILAGLTGSGKSSLARLVAESMGATMANGQFRRVAVRPDWIDQSEVLGFVNPTSNRFEPGWMAETVRACERQPDRLFFLLLDEMNLAPVEYYLAEMLSAMEEVRSGSSDVRIPLYARGAAPINAGEWPHELSYPANLVLIGTVNVDETTRPLSDRVIDRANVLQLRLQWSQRHHDTDHLDVKPLLVSFPEWRQVCSVEASDAHHDFLVDVAEILQTVGIGVGLRAHIELERFLSNSVGVLDDVVALDVAVLQRIIPKIRGFKRELAPALEELREAFEGAGCSTSAAVVDMWLRPNISDETYLDGTDPRVGLWTTP